MTNKVDSYAEQLDRTIAAFAGQFESILSQIVRQSVAKVVTEVAITQRWMQKPPADYTAKATGKHLGRPKGSKNKPKVVAAPVVPEGPHCSTAGCLKPIVAKGLCQSHYRKGLREQRRAGIPNGAAAVVAS